MNLKQTPCAEELKRMFASLRDKNDHHVLWVCETGQVHIDKVEPGMDAQAFAQQRPSMRLRLKTYHRGAGYVGPKAAADDQFINKVYDCLMEHWPIAERRSHVAYLDRYC